MESPAGYAAREKTKFKEEGDAVMVVQNVLSGAQSDKKF
jgi:hypothetical protein